MPPDMRVPGSWRLSTGGVPEPPPPTGAERRAEIVASSPACRRTRAISRGMPNDALWTAFFDRRHADQLVTTNGVEPHGRHNSEGRPQWWDVPGRTLEAVLEHIEDDNTSRYEYPPLSSLSHRRGSSWTLRRMESTTSSWFGSRSRGSPALLRIKPEPPLGRCTRSAGIVINEPDASSSRLVRPKTEPGLLPVKQDHLTMAANNEAALKWVWDDYVREEMERQRRTLEEIAARRRGREEGDVVILDESDEKAPRR
uniref:Uncharacterized protein n=1 Tax=Hordeum vulgare subsp. vulgare TaxID=112509 RepID=A0A8I6XZD0_HORVV